jgi:hypothetical protein
VKEREEVSMTDTTTRGAGLAERAQHAGGDGPAPSRRRRISTKRKQSAVLRLLRGEDLELVSREHRHRLAGGHLRGLLGIDHAVMGQRAIVVGGDGEEVNGSSKAAIAPL